MESGMKVRVLFFAATRDLAGASEATVTVPGSAPTVADLVLHLEATYPELSGRMATVRVAQNERFAKPEARLADGDVLALIPPVSGG
jgi:molybdopterin converting factor subunit 1